MVLQGLVPGLSAPVIYIGVSEHGSASMRLSVEAASRQLAPPLQVLAEAVARLEQEPSPVHQGPGSLYDSLSYVGAS